MPLAEKIRDRVGGTGFTSVSDYVTFVLREVLAGEAKRGKEPFTKEDEEKVKERLRARGYLK